MNKVFISDFTIKEVLFGGSEWVNKVIIDKFSIPFVYSQQVNFFDPSVFYIVSNISLMPQYILNQLINCNYILIEHDAKFCSSRHPWQYSDCIVPKNERINYDIYKRAKAVFVQTTDHLNVFLKNEVEANFINFKSSLWANEDLELIESLQNKPKNNSCAIYNSDNWIKNTKGSIDYCKKMNLDFQLISNQPTRRLFLELLSSCQKLVFFPLARETFCRLVVEARCFDMPIITTNNYGAVLEDWFKQYHGKELIQFLRENTKRNLDVIEKFIGV